MPDKILKKSSNTRPPDDAALFGRIVEILEEARRRVVRTVNSSMVVAYWLIGREIVEEEQHGQERADYGRAMLQELSRQLGDRYGRGFSVPTLQNCRKFYLAYTHRLAIQYPLGTKFNMSAFDHHPSKEIAPKQSSKGGGRAIGFHPNLSWSHYRALMRIENDEARQSRK